MGHVASPGAKIGCERLTPSLFFLFIGFSCGKFCSKIETAFDFPREDAACRKNTALIRRSYFKTPFFGRLLRLRSRKWHFYTDI